MEFMSAFPNGAAIPSKPEAMKSEIGLHSYFKNVGVLVSRPGLNSICQMGVSIKASGNVSHSHDDVGSFIIAFGNEQPLGDPGEPKYYFADSFGEQRLTRKFFNSYGYPYTLISGNRQLDATKIHLQTIKTVFADQQDDFAIDMLGAYNVPRMKKLIRTMRYNREGSGWVSIEDQYEFSQPETFEISLTMHGKYISKGAYTLEFTMGKETLVVEIEASEEVKIVTDSINENGLEFRRVGVRIKIPYILDF